MRQAVPHRRARRGVAVQAAQHLDLVTGLTRAAHEHLVEEGQLVRREAIAAAAAGEMSRAQHGSCRRAIVFGRARHADHVERKRARHPTQELVVRGAARVRDELPDRVHRVPREHGDRQPVQIAIGHVVEEE